MTPSSAVFIPETGVKELSGDSPIVAGITDITSIMQGVDILRIYTSVDDVPFALLDALNGTTTSLRELHICIQLHLRPALQNIQDSHGLRRAIISTMQKWQTSGTLLKFCLPLSWVTSEAAENLVHFHE